MKSSIFLMLCLLFYFEGVCQTEKQISSLAYGVTSDPLFIPTSGTMKISMDTSIYKDIKQLNLSTFKVFEYGLNSYELFFEYYNRGMISDSIYNLIVKKNRLEDVKFSNYTNDYTIAVLIGKTYSGNIVVVPDLNNNNRFNDDIQYFIPRISFKKKVLIPNLIFNNIDYSTGKLNKLLSTPFDLIVYPEEHGIDNCSIQLLNREIWKGTLKIGDDPTDFSINLLGNQDFVHFSDILISFGNIFLIKAYQKSTPTFFRKNDSMRIKNYIVVLDSVSAFGERAYFTLVKSKSGFIARDYFSSLKAFNLKNDKIERAFDAKKLKIVDFWATWCLPCLKEHETLKKDFAKFPSVSIIGILMDDRKNISLAKRYISKKSLSWKNFLVDNKGSENKFTYLKIDMLPTYLILDSNNNLIIRVNNVRDLINYFDSELKNTPMVSNR